MLDADDTYAPRSVEVTLPDGKPVTFGLKRVGDRGFLNHKQLADALGVVDGTLSNACRAKATEEARAHFQ